MKWKGRKVWICFPIRLGIDALHGPSLFQFCMHGSMLLLLQDLYKLQHNLQLPYHMTYSTPQTVAPE